jgi:hypothetical protein
MRNQIKTFLNSLQISSGGNWRGDCICGGKNTLSVTNEFGTLKYNCFRASCTIGGELKGDMSYEDIGFYLELSSGLRSSEPSDRFVPADHWVSANRPECFKYLNKFGCLEAYADKRVDIRYDPKQNRVVFLIKDEGECYGAVGRALDFRTNPKWFIYHSSLSVPFRVCTSNSSESNISKQAILVEDATSATSASRVLDSFALLGTVLHPVYIPSLRPYDVIYVALDKDASSKAIDIQRELSFFCNDVRVVLLEEDLKYLGREEICRVLSYGKP